MPIACRNKLLFRQDVLRHRLPDPRPALAPVRPCEITAPGDVPPPHRARSTSPMLDMNHGWPNLGHDSIVHAVHGHRLRPAARAPRGRLQRARALVRRAPLRHDPGAPGGRFALYLGTGGPGHIDPRAERRQRGQPGHPRGRRPGSAPLFRLFDAIRADEDAALVSRLPHLRRDVPLVGRRAAGPARAGEGRQERRPARERADARGAGSTPGSRSSRDELPDHRRLRILDNRLFDLIPDGRRLPAGRACRSATRPWASAARAATRSPCSSSPATRTASCRASSASTIIPRSSTARASS